VSKPFPQLKKEDKLAPNVMFENAKLRPNGLFVHILAPLLGAPNVGSAPFNILSRQNKRQ
jgi:hypothetical protein